MMRIEWEQLQEIKAVLSKFPKGLTISRIAREMDSNRNTVARYLDVLQISGQVEMQPVGPAKLYSLSERIPLDSMMDIISDAIVVLDRNERVVDANERFLKLAGMKKEEIRNATIEDVDLPEILDSEFLHSWIEALEGKRHKFDVTYPTVGGVSSFSVQIVPTILENGEPGVAVLINDVSEQRRAKDMVGETFEILEILMESVNASICVVDFENNKILYANYMSLSAFGCSKGNVCWQGDDSTKEKYCSREMLFDIEPLGVIPKEGLSYFQHTADNSIWSFQEQIIRWHDRQIARLRISQEVKKI